MKTTFLILTLFISFLSGQGLVEKTLIKALMTFDPTMKKLNERINESNGKKAALTFQDLDGKKHSIDKFQGKVVLVDMWATWCSPCVKQIPDLNILQEKYGNDGLVILSITDEDRPIVRDFLTKHELKTELGFIKYDDDVAEPFRHFRRGRPMYFLVDRNGVIRSGSMFKPSERKINKWLRK